MSDVIKKSVDQSLVDSVDSFGLIYSQCIGTNLGLKPYIRTFDAPI